MTKMKHVPSASAGVLGVDVWCFQIPELLLRVVYVAIIRRGSDRLHFPVKKAYLNFGPAEPSKPLKEPHLLKHLQLLINYKRLLESILEPQ